MNVTERAALDQRAALYDEMTAAVDERTLEIIDRRRRTTIVKGRGWLVRRMLLLADLVGLSVAFLVAQVLLGPGAGAGNLLDGAGELLLFAATLPVWVVVAKLYGLYDHDEERTDHSTADDVAGVFHMLTVGSWLLVAGIWLTRIAEPNFRKIVLFWALGLMLVVLARASPAPSVAGRSPTSRTRSSSARATSASWSRASSSSIPSTGSTSSASSTPNRRSAATTSSI